ncbi:MAG: hypothetical protein HZB38_07205 [Planctomycetes bacterium]|nr:hypothetical protein [Planctomycetota bacterium]
MSNSTRIYVVYWDEGHQRIVWSDDLGVAGSWHGPVEIFPNTVQGELGVDGPIPRVGPNGELYVISADADANGLGLGVWMHRARTLDAQGAPVFDDGIRVATRLHSWGFGGDCPEISGNFRVPDRAYLAVDPDPLVGTLYCVYMDRTRVLCNVPPGGGTTCLHDVDVWFTKSPAQAGQTPGDSDSWTIPKVINVADSVPYDQFFPWIEVDQSHRLHLVFYDTLGGLYDGLGPVTDGDPEARLRTRYSYSMDAGTSWTEQTIAPKWAGCPETWQTVHEWGLIGDYNGLAAAGNRVYPVYMASQGPENAPPSPPKTRIYFNEIVWP